MTRAIPLAVAMFLALSAMAQLADVIDVVNPGIVIVDFPDGSKAQIGCPSYTAYPPPGVIYTSPTGLTATAQVDCTITTVMLSYEYKGLVTNTPIELTLPDNSTVTITMANWDVIRVRLGKWVAKSFDVAKKSTS